MVATIGGIVCCIWVLRDLLVPICVSVVWSASTCTHLWLLSEVTAEFQDIPWQQATRASCCSTMGWLQPQVQYHCLQAIIVGKPTCMSLGRNKNWLLLFYFLFYYSFYNFYFYYCYTLLNYRDVPQCLIRDLTITTVRICSSCGMQCTVTHCWVHGIITVCSSVLASTISLSQYMEPML